MFDQEFGRWLAQLGVGGVLAGVLFAFYRKDVRQFTDLWKEQASSNRLQTEAMMGVVKENTAAFVRSGEVLKSLHIRVDRIIETRAGDFAHHRVTDPIDMPTPRRAP